MPAIDRIPGMPTRVRRALEGIGSDFVPYTGAIKSVDIGAFNFTTTGLGTFGSLDVDTLNFNGNVISDSTGTISLDNDNLITSGIVDADGLIIGATTGGTITNILNEDNMVSDSQTALATQQSIKAYVDGAVLTQEEVEDFAGEMVANATGTHTGITITYQDATNDMDFDVDHNAATNYVADQHVAHTGVTLTAGVGIAGGGDISANRTFDLDILNLVTDTIAAGDWVPFHDLTDAPNKIAFSDFEGTLNHDALTNFAAAEHIDWSATGAEDIHADRITAAVVTQHVASIDHDALLNFAANEHYLQTAITNISTALATGLVKVTTGTGALSIITDSSTNWDIAYGWGDHAGLYDPAGTMTTHEGAFTHADIALNTTHRGSTGADHSYLDQSVAQAASPTFVGLTLGALAGVLKAAAGVVSGSAALNDLSDVNAAAPNNNDALTWDAGTSKWIPEAVAGAGETNTASSAGTGVSLYFQKTVADLEFNAIKSENNRLTVALDGTTHDIELTLTEGNIDHNALANYVADKHIDWTAAAVALITSGYGDFASIYIGGVSYIRAPNATSVCLGPLAGDAGISGVANLCVGYNAGTAITTGIGHTCIGYGTGQAIVDSNYNTFLGVQAGVNVTGGGNICIGVNSGSGITTGGGNFTFGDNAGNYGAGTGNIAIGYSAAFGAASVGLDRTIAIGNLAQPTANHQLVIGGPSGDTAYIDDAYFGSSVIDTAPVDVAINATGGSGTDIAGADLTLAGGKGTGNAAGGEILLKTSVAGASGDTLQTLATAVVIDANQNVDLPAGRISSNHLITATAGPTDNLNVANVNTVIMNCTDNSVTIGGFIGGVVGQVLHVLRVEKTIGNTAKLEHAKEHAFQQIFLYSGLDSSLLSRYGGWTLICDGTHWYEVYHA